MIHWVRNVSVDDIVKNEIKFSVGAVCWSALYVTSKLSDLPALFY